LKSRKPAEKNPASSTRRTWQDLHEEAGRLTAGDSRKEEEKKESSKPGARVRLLIS